MNRRGFLGLLGAAIFGSKLLTAPAKAIPVPAVAEVVGINIRFVSHCDALGYHFTRIYVFYGLSVCSPELSCRIEG